MIFAMKPTRRTQPFKKGTGRPLSAALKAATKGAMADGSNPMDAKRALEKGAPPNVAQGQGALGGGKLRARKPKPRIGGGLAGHVKRKTRGSRNLY